MNNKQDDMVRYAVTLGLFFAAFFGLAYFNFALYPEHAGKVLGSATNAAPVDPGAAMAQDLTRAAELYARQHQLGAATPRVAAAPLSAGQQPENRR